MSDKENLTSDRIRQQFMVRNPECYLYPEEIKEKKMGIKEGKRAHWIAIDKSGKPPDILREKIIDLLHWQEYRFIGDDNAILEGSLTQGSEERIADAIIHLIREAEREGLRGALKACRNALVTIVDTDRPVDTKNIIVRADEVLAKFH